MREAEFQNYKKLNELAEQGGIVIFGSDEDKNIPVGELCQEFAVESKIYNRSFENLSVTEAVSVYDAIVAPLTPEIVLLHIGEADIAFFKENPTEFANKYLGLIKRIKVQNRKCEIAVISLKNHNNEPQKAEMNKYLKYIADSEKCEYGDLSVKKVWNPRASMDAVSFLHSIGFVHSLKNKCPLYDIIKMLFFYNA